jgi:hypothetical protein
MELHPNFPDSPHASLAYPTGLFVEVQKVFQTFSLFN